MRASSIVGLRGRRGNAHIWSATLRARALRHQQPARRP